MVVEDVAAGPLLDEYRAMIRSRPCHVIVLLPSMAAVAERETKRNGTGYDRWEVESFYDGFVETTPRVGLWLDTTDLAPEQTVAEIVRRCR